MKRAMHRERVDLDDLNSLGARLGIGHRCYFTADSWNTLIDFANERSHPDLSPLPRHRRGAILTSAEWNALVDRIEQLENR